MVAYCPLDIEEPEERLPPKRAPPRRRPKPKKLRDLEDSECNYVVMFFIVGVVVLALSDNVK